MHVCMSIVCLYACMSVCYVCMHVCADAYIYIYMYICMYVLYVFQRRDPRVLLKRSSNKVCRRDLSQCFVSKFAPWMSHRDPCTSGHRFLVAMNAAKIFIVCSYMRYFATHVA